MKTLSQPALDIIHAYLNLPIAGHTLSCPYFNNKRNKVRGALRVFIGKGSSEDIVDETTLLALREKIDLATLSPDKVRQFLVDHNIGVDCSALAYYILDAEAKARGKSGLQKILRFPLVKNPVRKLLTRLRPVENTNVETFADEVNSTEVVLNDVAPGDIVVMIGTGERHDLNHILIVHGVETFKEKMTCAIHYTHSLAWSSDGKYTHGVRQGVIEVVDPHKNLLDQKWTEQDKTGDANETWWRAKTAERLEIRRLKI